MIDLRSDILAEWSPQALSAFSAAVHDRPGFVRGEDPHLQALESFAAETFGFERALFLPTCTMANQIAIRIWCAPGSSIILDSRSHIAVNELASTTKLNHAHLHFVESKRGHIIPQAVVEALKDDSQKFGLVVVENTHNRAGGTVMPPGWMAEIANTCQGYRVPLHLDGARLWNAAVSCGDDLRTLANSASSVSVSLNKSIGAPVGALLMGKAEFICQAAQIQKLLGGLWRPVGTLAAAALQAAMNCRSRVERDHQRAALFADELRNKLPDGAGVDRPETNIVMMSLPGDGMVEMVLDAMAQRRVLATDYGQRRIRFVFHSGIQDSTVPLATTRILASVAECFRSRPAGHDVPTPS